MTDAQRTGAAYALVDPGTKLAYGLQLMDWTVLHRSKDLVLMEPPPGWTTGRRGSRRPDRAVRG